MVLFLFARLLKSGYQWFQTSGALEGHSKRRIAQRTITVRMCVFLCKSVSDLSLIKLDQSWPGSIAAVVQDQVGQDRQVLYI